MTVKSHRPTKPKSATRKGSATTSDNSRVTASGREVWRVIRDGRVQTLITTSSSAQAMNEGMEIYADALRRLAKR
jgi:hypothetical protein